MTERIDHVAEALSCEEAGLSIMRQNPMASHMEAVMQFDIARLHAQLALVEQQRIANLLTMAQFDHAIEDGVRLYTDLEWSAKLRQEAGERLGLS